MPAASEATPFPVRRVVEVVPRPPEQAWLVESLWGLGAVGFVGGAPKSCKTWLGCELAYAVATGGPALGRFPVASPGTVVFYAAEDDQASLRARFSSIACARGGKLEDAPILLLDVTELRLDRENDLARLRSTIAAHRPALLVLDPFVRMARIDENSASEVSAVLGELRAIQRELGTAILVAHHMRKSASGHKGYQLRGSGDFAAWHDSALYMSRRADGEVVLQVEHRGAAAPAPLRLRLVDGDSPHLALIDAHTEDVTRDPNPLRQAILELLAVAARPLTSQEVSTRLRLRKKTVTDALADLRRDGHAARGERGWELE